MALLPVSCTRCDAIWATDFISGNASNVTLVGNTVGPCPQCGGIGRLADGVFNLVDDVAHLVGTVRGSGMSAAEIRSLLRILQTAQRSQARAEEVVRDVAQQIPGAQPIVVEVVRRSSGADWKFWLMFLISLLGVMLTYQQVRGSSESLSPDDVRSITEIVRQEVGGDPSAGVAGGALSRAGA